MYRRNNLAYRVVDSFFRHKWIFLISTLATTLLVLGVLLFRSQGYSAVAYVGVDTDKDFVGPLGERVDPWVNPANDHAQSFMNRLQDNGPEGFLSMVVTRASLRTPIDVSGATEDKRLTYLLKNVSANGVSKDVMAIRLNWPDKAECERILNSFFVQYKKYTSDKKTAGSTRSVSFLDLQLKGYRDQMSNADVALENFRRKNFGRLPSSGQTILERLSALKSEQDYLNITIGDYEKRIAFLENRRQQLASNPNIVAESVISRSPNIDKLDVLRQERDRLIASGYIITSEEVQDVNRQILEMQKVISREAAANPEGIAPGKRLDTQTVRANPALFSVEDSISEAKILAETQRERRKLLAAEIAKYEKAAGELPKAERELTEKTRDADVYQKMMQEMQMQKEKLSLKSKLDQITSDSSIELVGRITAEPTLSTLKLLAMIGGSILLGLATGGLIVMAREWMDPAIRYEPDVERSLGVPVLAGLLDSREVLALPENDGKRLSRPVLPMPPAA